MTTCVSVVQHAESIAAKFEHYSGSKSRADLLTILTEIMRLELDPKLSEAERQSLEEAIWNQTCARLGIDNCVCQELTAMLARCCAKTSKCGGCGCFSALVD